MEQSLFGRRGRERNMATNTFEVFYLGTMADMDPDESNTVTENADDLVGLTFGSDIDPLWQEITTLTVEDANDDGYVDSNDAGLAAEDLTYGGTSSALDSSVEYWITVTYTDGSTATTEMMVIQDVSGRVFLSPLQTGDSQNDVLDDKPIESITLDSVSWDSAEDIYLDVESDAFIVCFAGGTLIETDQGQINVARLSVGDRVRTMDHGYQALRWISGRRVRAFGNHAPIRIEAGALGSGLPRRALRVSPQHRILVRSKIAMRMFGTPEVLIAAKKLVGLPGITVDKTMPYVTYWHFLFNRHEIVFSEGAATESLFTGPEALKAIGLDARHEIISLFPQLDAASKTSDAARKIIHGHARNRMVVRHKKNAQSVFQA